MKRAIVFSLFVVAALCFSGSAFSQQLRHQAGPRVPQVIDDSRIDVGPADPAAPIDGALVFIPLSADASTRLDMFLRDVQDRSSSRYHQWLTPEQFADQFAAPKNAIEGVRASLGAAGLRVTSVSPSRTFLKVTGSAAAFQQAFRTPVHRIQTSSKDSYAFASPVATTLAGVRVNVLMPEDMHLRSFAHRASPSMTLQGDHYLAPADWATIYNVNPIYQAGYKGGDSSGTVNIAIVGQSDIDPTDVSAFQQYFGLPNNAPEITHVDTAPGKTGDEGEGDLDVEWALAIAPQAHVRYYVSSKGALVAALQAVQDNFSSIVSVSFGICETKASQNLTSAIDGLWQQAASQGISVFVSSGDSGASGCDAMSSSVGTGASPNAICAPSATCIGGTQFDDTANPSQWWSSTNDPTTQASARGYIPEIAWNESGGSGGLASSGGGVSGVYGRQSWQTAPGVPGGNMRTSPDISANAGHVGYVVVQGGKLVPIIGTSASAPTLAALFGLIRQRLGRLGNVNPTLYQIGNAQYTGSGATVFHDVTSGNNSVPGVSGFNCGFAYDMVTGLGSPDANALMNVMAGSGGTPPPAGPCVANSTTACVLNNRFKVNVRYRGAFDNNPADTDALLKNVGTAFASSSFETVFFYFNSPNNIEMLLKMLDQGNTNSAGQPTIAVLFGSATPLRMELTITDTQTGAVKRYTSGFATQAGSTDFTAFVK